MTALRHRARSRARPSSRQCRGDGGRWSPICARNVDDVRPGRRRGGARRGISRAASCCRATGCAALLDPGSPFLELSPAGGATACTATRCRRPASSPASAASSGRECVIVANDATVKGGTYYPDDGEEASARAGDRARRTGCPASIWSIPAAPTCRTRTRCFPTASISAASSSTRPTCRPQGIPQIAVVMGSCTAGGAYVPAMCDESIIVRKPGHDLPRRPAAGEGGDRRDRQAEDLGGADVHARISGVADHLRRERRARAGHRAPHRRPAEHGASGRRWIVRAPRAAAVRSGASCYGVVPADPRAALRRARGDRAHRRRQRVRRVQARCTARRWSPASRTSGAIRSASSPTTASCSPRVALKGAHFIELCAQRGIPLVFLQNITGFMVGRKYEAGGIAKDGAKMVTAVATAAVPKFTVIIGGSFGAGNYGMCGRAYAPRFLWMWPNARISVMGGEQAASVLAHGAARRHGSAAARPGRPRTRRRSRRRSASSTKRRAIPTTPRARLWDDGIIDPADTPPRAGAGAVGGAERADRGDALRRVPDVSAMFRTLLIANRGEIACRVIAHRAAHGHRDGRGLFRRRCASALHVRAGR